LHAWNFAPTWREVCKPSKIKASNFVPTWHEVPAPNLERKIEMMNMKNKPVVIGIDHGYGVRP